MNSDKRQDTSRNVPKENWTYPLHVSDRADELIGQLDETQVLQLYNALKTMSYGEWSGWILDDWVKISQYDCLTPRERSRRLQKPTGNETLLLHHACIYTELWRARIEREYLCLPPRGGTFDTPESHREMMLAIVSAYYKDDQRDLWPFDHFDIDDRYPFRLDA